ncbi:THO complex, subunit 5 [Ascosphaera apis ARSEF 7405]|uniref:THO complex, subunit 5 n=1 Tax=Ascosphaera apis ARSEF 7405 TaxID=392613 RepID=A0A167UZ73_9EURO|nr:THO complex, subunit 5 [Ascosphaera apis ARSEF 7405]
MSQPQSLPQGNTIISDPALQPILLSAADALAHCQQLLNLINPSSLPSPATHDSIRAISLHQKRIFASLAKLRGQNRDLVHAVRATKQATAEARAEIDRLHLHLQNLYYEQRHLTGEIAACESYDHRYRDLPLIPEEEFLELFPDQREASPHDRMVARINHEHAEREALEQQRQQLLKKRQALIAENKKRKDDLASLDKDLEKFIDVRILMIYGVNWF